MQAISFHQSPGPGPVSVPQQADGAGVLASPTFRDIRKHSKQTQTNTTMKKMILIVAAAALVASVGIGYAANSMRQVEEHSKCGMGMKCTFCNGTGWKGNFKCFHCNGTGANSAY